MAFVRAIVLGYRKHGLDPRPALARVNLTLADVRREGGRITAAQMEQLSALAMQELDDEALGWFSRKLPWGTYGMLCRASLGAPSLGVALARWCRHHRLVTEDVRLRLIEHGERAELRVEEACELGPMREMCLLSCLRYVHAYASWLIDSRFSQIEVTFPFARPAHADVYDVLFPGPVRFDAEHTALHFDAGYLRLPPRRDEPALSQMLRRALLLTVRPVRKDRLLTERIRAVLCAPEGLTRDAGDVARALHLSVRTLHRHLHSEGTSFHRLKDETRRERAKQRLTRTRRTVKQIAAELGFDNDKSFIRAFRAWFGETPHEYRTRLCA